MPQPSAILAFGIRNSRSNGTALSATQTQSLQCILYGVYALVKVHFAKEEEIYLPILDLHLTPKSAQEMFEALEDAAHKVRKVAASGLTL